MKEITDDVMKQLLMTTKAFTAVILKKGPQFNNAESKPILWEHARRNMQLREEGLLSVVFPINSETEMAGIGIFNADAEQTKHIIEGDPAIEKDVLIYEIYPTRSFPGDKLPG